VTRGASLAQGVSVWAFVVAMGATMVVRLAGSFSAPLSAILAGTAGLALFVALGGVIGSVALRRGAGRARDGDVEVDPRGIRVDGVLAVPLDAIEKIEFVPHVGATKGEAVVYGPGKRRRLVLYVDSPAEVVEMRTVLGLAADGSPARSAGVRSHALTARGPAIAGMVALLAIMGGAAAFAPAGVTRSSFALVLALVPALALGAFLARYRARIGAEGVDITGRPFLPWSEVVAIEPRGLATVLHTRSGEIVLRVRARGEAPAALAADLRAAFERYLASEHADVSARLERRGRDASEWLDDVGRAREGFRSAPLTGDQLERVALDPTSDPSARAAAALLLARKGEGERVRVAVEGCSLPRLRVALERAAGGAEEEAVQEAVAAVESADAPSGTTAGA